MYKLYFDGGADPNPGKAGAGAVIYEKNEEILSVSIYVGDHETNNVAEYTGLIAGLELALENNICDITVKGDSQLVIKQMNEVSKKNMRNCWRKKGTRRLAKTCLPGQTLDRSGQLLNRS